MDKLATTKAILGESPLWCETENALYWVDIKAPCVLRFDVGGSAVRQWAMPSEIGAIGKVAPGLFVVSLRDGVMLFETASGALRPLASPEHARPGYRLNEGRIDPRGRLWVGSVEDPGFTPQGCLYCIDDTGEPVVKDRGIAMPNALGWSPDGRTMYFADSFQRKIWMHDFDPDTAHIENRRVFAEIPDGEGFPDGLTVDSEGCVWNAQIDGWRVTRYAPDGRVERVVKLPVRRPTSLAFGGPDYATLFITTATFRLTPEELNTQPLAGHVLAFSPGVKGRPEPAFSASAVRDQNNKPAAAGGTVA